MSRIGFVMVLGVLLGACTSGPGASPPPAPRTTTVAVPGSPSPTSGPSPRWLTYQRDPSRTGSDPSSPPLDDVRAAWTSSGLDGAVYAQPLLFGGHVIVATENDSVYALDQTTGEVVWRTHVGEPIPGSDLPCGNIDPSGITGTPAIDPSSGLLYAVAFVEPGRHQLVAIDAADGRIRFRRPVDPPGVDPLVHQQRAALAIDRGRVYAAFGGLFGDCGEYHGVVVGISLDGTGPLLQYRVPSERAAGIWAPSGPAVDPKGNLLVATGNSFSTSTFDFGDSVIRLSPELQPIGWFAPADWRDLNAGDVDLGSVGPAPLPGGLVFQVGKAGVGYLLRLEDLGGIGGAAFSARVCDGAAFGGTAWMAPRLYVPCSDGLVALDIGPGASFGVAWKGPGFPAGPPIVAGGAAWTVDVASGDLFAFDAATGRPRFSAHLGQVTHFTSPVAGGGRVFVATVDRVLSFSWA